MKMEVLSHKTIHQPIVKVSDLIMVSLKNKKNDLLYHIILGLVKTCFDTYISTIRLTAQEPKFPLQAHILCRTIIDSIFTVVYILEKPESRAKAYEKAHYREMREEYERLRQKYHACPEWTSYLAGMQAYMDLLETTSGISSSEKADLKKIDHWPIPSHIKDMNKKKDPLINPKNLRFLREFYKWKYGRKSAWSHMQYSGILMGAGRDCISAENYEKFGSDAVAEASIYLAMLLSEVESHFHFGTEQDLRETWTILSEYFPEAKEYYEDRYSVLLSTNDVRSQRSSS